MSKQVFKIVYAGVDCVPDRVTLGERILRAWDAINESPTMMNRLRFFQAMEAAWPGVSKMSGSWTVRIVSNQIQVVFTPEPVTAAGQSTTRPPGFPHWQWAVLIAEVIVIGYIVIRWGLQ